MPGQIEGVKTGQSLEPSQADLIDAFARGLRARNRSARTIKSYCDTANRFVTFLQDQGMPTSPTAVTREHIETYIADQLDRFTPSTADTRYRCLQQYFRWLDDEGEIPSSPMAKMSPPQLTDQPVDVVNQGDLRKWSASCSGKTFDDRRDTAILMLFIDTGMFSSPTCSGSPTAISPPPSASVRAPVARSRAASGARCGPPGPRRSPQRGRRSRAVRHRRRRESRTDRRPPAPCATPNKLTHLEEPTTLW